MRSVCLMYHDVYAGAGPAPGIPRTAARYHVSKDRFRRQLAAVRSSGLPVCTVREHLGGAGIAERDHVVITFDDGWLGSFTEGLECLRDAGISATFFVTRDNVDRRHYASRALLREASEAGMELGTHGCGHRMLAGCSRAEVHVELAESKAFLEDLVGESVTTGSVPGGDWSASVAQIARECGYVGLCTSRPGLNRARTDPFRLRRMAVRDGMGPDTIERYCRFSVGGPVLRHGVLELPKRVLGMERYSRLRRRLLGVSAQEPSWPD